MQIVREFTTVDAGQWCIETTARSHQPKPAVAPAATNEELRRAFDDLLIAMAPAERAVVTRDLRGRAIGRPQPKRQLDTSPEAIAQARQLFGL